MSVVLPTKGREEASFEIAPRLDGTRWRILLAYNTRTLSWSMSLRTIDRVDTASGLAVRVGQPLTAAVPASKRPPGQIVALDTSGQSLDPDRDAFRTGRVKLIYVTAEELAGAA